MQLLMWERRGFSCIWKKYSTQLISGKCGGLANDIIQAHPCLQMPCYTLEEVIIGVSSVMMLDALCVFLPSSPYLYVEEMPERKFCSHDRQTPMQ